MRRRGIRGESEVKKRCALASRKQSKARSSEVYSGGDWFERDATILAHDDRFSGQVDQAHRLLA